MKKGRAFFVVGHSNWGKSRTLRALTGGLQHSILIGSKQLLIKRMSNDDDEKSIRRWLRQRDPGQHPRILVAFCPKLTTPDKSAAPLLALIRSKYDLFFWVQNSSYHGTRTISDRELAALKKHGHVYLYREHVAASTRARDLRRYLIAHI